jgi:hypothetical protein
MIQFLCNPGKIGNKAKSLSHVGVKVRKRRRLSDKSRTNFPLAVRHFKAGGGTTPKTRRRQNLLVTPA